MFKELGLCSYRVECSSELVQEMVQVSGAMVRLPAPCSLLAVCYHVSKRQRLGFNCSLFSARRLYRSRLGGLRYCYLTHILFVNRTIQIIQII